MATANIPDSKLQAALAEVEQELKEMAKAEQEKAAKLAKAREESGSAPSGSAPSASGSPSPEGAPSEGSPSGAPPAGPEGAPASAPSAAPTADPSAPPPGDPAAAGAGAMPTLEQIVAEYSKLPPEEMKLYYLGIKTALAQTMGAGAGMDPSASAGAPGAGAPGPSAPPPSAPPAPSAPPMSPMGKSEKDALEGKLAKSEQAVAEMQRDLATLSKALELVVGQPQRKGVTGIEYVKRAAPSPEPEAPVADPTKLAKSELSKSLIGMVRSGKSATGQKLSKSDMDNISKFSEGGSKDLTLVKHLFAPAAK